jgi:hypothetical protein
MIAYQTSSAEERTFAWREFRKSIEHLTIDEQISEVAKFFSTVPIGARSLDFYTPSTWPTPWEILFHETYCQNTISLLIYYSLKLIPNFNKKVDLWLIDDEEDRFIVPVINDQYILNYELGLISTLPNLAHNITVIERFDPAQIKQIS